MTKAQRADALLENARIWQINDGISSACQGWFYPSADEVPGFPQDRRDVAASAALSEASALGYDLENADGKPVEKVAVVLSTSMPCPGRPVTYLLRTVQP